MQVEINKEILPLIIVDNTAYDKKNKDNFKCRIPNIMDKIANKTLSQLQKDGIFIFPEILINSDDLTENQLVLESTKDSYITHNVMGCISYKDEVLIIKSRFSGDGEDYFLKHLLSKVFDVPNILDSKISANNMNPILNFLPFIFSYYLKLAMRKGIYKEYVIRQYNDESVRGIIDIKQHIKNNIPFVGKFAYDEREFSYDNNLTELIRHTIEFIKTKKYGRAILLKVKDEVRAIIDTTKNYRFCDRQKVINENIKKVIRHPYYYEYQKLQKLCIMILGNEYHNIGYSKNKINGLLFDGAWLWEEYINTLIGKKFYHPKNKEKALKQYLFNSSDFNGEGMEGRIYPDFVSNDRDERIIVDAKYKPKENIGNGNRDYFQILAYMLRFEANIGYFIYPYTSLYANLDIGTSASAMINNRLKSQNLNSDINTSKIEKMYLNGGIKTDKENNVTSRNDIYVVKCGLEIPQNVETFEKDIKKSEEELRKEFGLSN